MKLLEIKSSESGKFLKNRSSILAWINKHNGLAKGSLNPTLFIIDDDGEVSYPVGLTLVYVDQFKVQFNEIAHNFKIANSSIRLKSLRGAPKKVGGEFSLVGCNLHSLEYGPTEVGSFYCANNKSLVSLEHAPKMNGKIKYAQFNVYGCGLTSLKHCPEEILGDFNCSNNKLTTIEDMPRRVQRDLFMDHNQITSLKGIHKRILHIGNRISLGGNPIKDSILGLLLIDELKIINVSNDDDPNFIQAIDIIKKYLGKGKSGVLDAQKELMDADLEDYAEL